MKKIFFFFFKDKATVAQTSLRFELTVQLKMKLNFWSSYFLLQNARITDMGHSA